MRRYPARAATNASLQRGNSPPAGRCTTAHEAHEAAVRRGRVCLLTGGAGAGGTWFPQPPRPRVARAGGGSPTGSAIRSSASTSTTWSRSSPARASPATRARRPATQLQEWSGPAPRPRRQPLRDPGTAACGGSRRARHDQRRSLASSPRQRWLADLRGGNSRSRRSRTLCTGSTCWTGRTTPTRAPTIRTASHTTPAPATCSSPSRAACAASTRGRAASRILLRAQIFKAHVAPNGVVYLLSGSPTGGAVDRLVGGRAVRVAGTGGPAPLPRPTAGAAGGPASHRTSRCWTTGRCSSRSPSRSRR